MTRESWLLPAVVLLAAVLAGWLPRRASAAVAVLATAVATALAVPLAIQAVGLTAPVQTAVELAPTGSIAVSAATLIDPLAGVIALMVCCVALAVQVYSVEYLRADTRYPTYAAEVALFTAAMLTVTISGDLLALLVGWEVMGLCSYLLIGHYRDLPEAPPAAVKAFLVTRVGDVGFLLGILLLGLHAHTFRIAGVLAAVPSLPAGSLTVATLLIVAGVVGKSAQFPLHTWLPDAMAGPTPISALIHAATMVAAGVYVVLRLHPVFVAAPATLAVLAVLAAVTMLLGGLAALGQDDIKRVLAWSTVSQLGYALAAAAVGSVAASAFHLLTHAAFKALLFLCAGAVLHAAGTGLMSRLGGLWRHLPVTFAATLVGSVALVGLIPLSGGFSKEAVLDAAYAAARGRVAGVPGWTGWVVLVAALATVLLTAGYVTRLLLRTFAGPPREVLQPHEPGGFMRWPVLALAVAAAGLGVLIGPLPGWLGGELHIGAGLSVASVGLVGLGSVVTYAVWRRDPAADPVGVLGVRVTAALANGLYLDRVQDALVVRPVRRLARIVSTVDGVVVDGAAEGVGMGSLGLGRWLARRQPAGVQLYLTGLLAGSVLVALAVAVTPWR